MQDIPIAYINGSCANNEQLDQRKRRGLSVATDPTGSLLAKKVTLGGSNNIAEFTALLLALEWARESGHRTLAIKTNCQTIRSWEKGIFGKKLCDRDTVMKLYRYIEKLREEVSFTLDQIPRAENVAASYVDSHYGLMYQTYLDNVFGIAAAEQEIVGA